MKPKSREEAARTAGAKAREYMDKYGSCSQSTLLALQDTFDLKDESVFKAAGAMTGGIGGMQDACGSLCGASLMFGQVLGRGINEYADKDKLMGSMTAAGQLYKWYEKEFGSPTCKEIRTTFGGGVYYDMHIPWQAELAKEARVHEQCVTLAEKTAARAAEILWDEMNKKPKS
ncbi:MAG: C-GCAxxG-C-C family protein [Dehalococcoidales bacterium]|jgi:C_GCAxxG_C_C family probable redox protein